MASKMAAEVEECCCFYEYNFYENNFYLGIDNANCSNYIDLCMSKFYVFFKTSEWQISVWHPRWPPKREILLQKVKPSDFYF